MKDIKIKLTAGKLAATYALFDVMHHPVLAVRSVRSRQYLLGDVSKKLGKKMLEKQNATEPFTLKLKYYEADVLEEYMRQTVDFSQDKYHYALASLVQQELHQKLA